MTTRKNTIERREEIVLAALSIIANDGLGRFTTARISRAVGISEGALFRHFASKDEILRETVNHIEKILMATTAPAEDPPMVALRKLFLLRATLLRRNPDLVKILFSHQLEQAMGRENQQQIIRLKQLSGRFIRERLEDAARLGQLRKDLPLRVLMLFFMGMLHVLVTQEPLLEGASLPAPSPVVPSPVVPASVPPDDPEVIWLSIEKFLKGE
jgi:AcrR family transcriptional regulator